MPNTTPRTQERKLKMYALGEYTLQCMMTDDVESF